MRRWRWTLFGSLLVYAAGVGGVVAVGLSTSGEAADFSGPIVPGFVVALGMFVAWRRPESPVAAPLVLLGAAPSLVSAIEAWGASYGSNDEMLAARAAGYLSPGVWVFNFTGFVMLCATFPTGLLPGRNWRALPLAFCCAALAVVGVVAIQPEQYAADGGPLPGSTPLDLPAALNTAADPARRRTADCRSGWSGCIGGRPISQRRRADPDSASVVHAGRRLGAGTAGGRVGGELARSSSVVVAYTPFMFGILIGLPTAVVVAILRHDLLDIDRVLNGTISWVLTTWFRRRSSLSSSSESPNRASREPGSVRVSVLLSVRS